ncbi:MAG: TorF family putative porin [Pseudomonadaceae bacterium]|nr:TorF family putative porin [Pseudomonadaceae bacterium]
MRAFNKFIAAATLASGALMTSSVASADVSYNIGYASEYYFRGVLQKNSSASVGADFEQGGFYAGTWAADVGDGLEVDGYFGYGIETDEGFTASLGFTGYYYTGEFDDTYEEINLNLGYGLFSLEYSVGEYDNFDGPDLDYDFLAGTVALENGLYGTYGTFGDDFDGDYIELGWGTTISEIDFGIALILSSDEISDQLDDDGDATESEAVVFTIGKTF